MEASASCLICGVGFRWEKLGPGRLRRFCSASCRDARKRKQRRQYRAERRYPAKSKARTIAKVCVVCTAAFLANDKKRQACSALCGGKLAKRRGDAGRRRNALARRRRVCEHCHHEFVARNPSGQARAGKSREGRFCSLACAAAVLRKPLCEVVA